jgi:uncharacterized surface protein with fasciclin (FAS1) repeats
MRRLLTITAAVLAIGAAPAAAQDKDIVETAAASGKFDTLTSLLEQAGLADTLKGDGPFTVFAPTDKAFAKVPQKTLDELAANPDKLRAVLLYHVAKRKLTAAKVVNRRSIKTLNGQRVRVRVRGKKVYVNRSRVMQTDVEASNGVIHVVNRVLIPR